MKIPVFQKVLRLPVFLLRANPLVPATNKEARERKWNKHFCIITITITLHVNMIPYLISIYHFMKLGNPVDNQFVKERENVQIVSIVKVWIPPKRQ